LIARRLFLFLSFGGHAGLRRLLAPAGTPGFNSGMRLFPVLDIKNGVVVRGVGGRRAEYRPVVSRLTASCQPIDVAEAFRSALGLDHLYIADLDAIAGAPPLLPTYDALRRRGFRLWVDAGVREAEAAAALADAGVEGLVLGLETIAGPETVSQACRLFGERVVFSLDLQAGVPLGAVSAWSQAEACAIAGQAVARGVRRLIVLDLARVGIGTGTGTEALCVQLVVAHPGVEIIAGGGVRGGADLMRLRSCGVAGVLVASALHDGTLHREDLAASGLCVACRHLPR
jgi:phosphoribosylformimino-5-aminoimidazole carboxamide ribotide isomerase